jgi:hypothetical protein
MLLSRVNVIPLRTVPAGLSLAPATYGSAERQDDDHNFELDLVLATIDTGGGATREGSGAEQGAAQPSQASSSLRPSELSSDHGRCPSESQVNT